MTLAPPVTEPAVAAALAAWALADCPATLVAARENRVFLVETPAGPLALRLHRPGLRGPEELAAELAWMSALAAGGLELPVPVPTRAGGLVHMDGDAPASLLGWVEGETMGRDGALAPWVEPRHYAALGAAMARMHAVSDAWVPPAGFSRPSWDVEGLVGDRPLWGRFWESPLLGPDEARLLGAARDFARDRLAALQNADFGLIHADLVPENVMFTGQDPVLIDFDDSGFGWRLFDLATTLNRCLRADDPVPLEAALIEGYRSVRPVDLGALPLFRALRAFTYVGWGISRAGEPGTEIRARRHIALACRMAQALLDAG